MHKQTLYSSVETDDEYRPRLRESSPNITPRAAVGLRIEDTSNLARGTGTISRISPASHGEPDIFYINWHISCVSETRLREQFRVLPLDFNALAGEDLDKIGDMVGVQRHIVCRGV